MARQRRSLAGMRLIALWICRGLFVVAVELMDVGEQRYVMEGDL